MMKKNVLLVIMPFLLQITMVMGSKDPKEFVMLLAPHPQRVDHGRIILIPAITPPRSPRPEKVYEKATRVSLGNTNKRLHPRGR